MADQIGENSISQRPDEPGGVSPGSKVIDANSPVKFKWTPTLIEEAGEDKTGAVWDVVIIEAGLSANDLVYLPTTLQKAAHLFEGAPIYEYRWGEAKGGEPGDRLQVHVDKRARKAMPAGFVGNLVGEIKNVRYDSVKRALVGQSFIDDEDLRERLKNRHERGSRNMPGLSIDAEGLRRGNVVLMIEDVHSVDVVTNPSAGGKLERLVAAQTQADVEDQAWKLRALSSRLAEGCLTEAEQKEVFTNMQALVAKMASNISREDTMEHTAATPGTPTATREDDHARWSEVIFLVEKALAGEGVDVGAILKQIQETAILALEGAPETASESDHVDPEKPEKVDAPESVQVTESTDQPVVEEVTKEAPVAEPVAIETETKPETESAPADETVSTEEEAEVDKETADKLEGDNTTLREEVETYKVRLREQAFTHEFDKVATELKIVDREAAQMLLDPEAYSYGDDGAITGLREALTAMLEERPWLKEAKAAPPEPVAINESKDSVDGFGSSLTEQQVRHRIGILSKRAVKGDHEAACEVDKLRKLLPA